MSPTPGDSADRGFEQPTRWEVVRSLTNAQVTTTRVLEDFVGQFDREAISEQDVQRQLERAIDSHEQVVEDLEYALAALEADEAPFAVDAPDREVDVDI